MRAPNLGLMVHRRGWGGGLWTYSRTLLESHFDSLDAEARALVREDAELQAHLKMMKNASAGRFLPSHRLICVHESVLDSNIPAEGQLTVVGICRAAPVIWEVYGQVEENEPEGCWVIEGHEDIGVFVSEGSAIAAAWSIAAPGASRARVRDAS